MGKKCFDHLRKVVESVLQQGVEPIQCRSFQTGKKSEAHDWIIVVVDHHLVLVVSDVLNRIAHSRIVVESGS